MRLRLIRDVRDERRRLPGASPILGPRDRDAPLAARQRDIGEPSLFVRVAIGGGDDAVLERRQEHMVELHPLARCMDMSRTADAVPSPSRFVASAG